MSCHGETSNIQVDSDITVKFELTLPYIKIIIKNFYGGLLLSIYDRCLRKMTNPKISLEEKIFRNDY